MEGEREAVVSIVVCCHMLYCLRLERQRERGGAGLVLCCHMLYLLYLRDLLPVSRRHVTTGRDRDRDRDRDRGGALERQRDKD